MPPAPRRGGGARGRGRGRGGRGSANTNSNVTTNAGANASAKTAAENKPKPDKRARKGGATGARNVGNVNANNNAGPRPTRAVSRVMRKVVVRNLPATYDDAKVRQWLEMQGEVAATNMVWRVVPGRARRNNRAPLMTRAYLDFKKDSESALAFVAKWNKTPMLDEKGRETSVLNVELAPFQKIPREKARKDPKAGTLERDPEYVAFLEELNKPKEKLPSADVVADAKDGEVAEKPVAALVRYLNERRRNEKNKKGKTNARALEKTRGARAKSAKDVSKASKDKVKGGKNKEKAAGEASAETPRTRKPRVTKTNAAKISVVTDHAEADTTAKPTRRTTEGNDDASTTREAKKSGGANGKTGGKTPRRNKNGTTDGASGKDVKPRGRREYRTTKNSKSGADGKDEQPKKLFAPKIRPQAG